MTRKKAERQDTLSMNILRLSQEIKRLSLSSVFRRDEVRYLKKKSKAVLPHRARTVNIMFSFICSMRE